MGWDWQLWCFPPWNVATYGSTWRCLSDCMGTLSWEVIGKCFLKDSFLYLFALYWQFRAARQLFTFVKAISAFMLEECTYVKDKKKGRKNGILKTGPKVDKFSKALHLLHNLALSLDGRKCEWCMKSTVSILVVTNKALLYVTMQFHGI